MEPERCGRVGNMRPHSFSPIQGAAALLRKQQKPVALAPLRDGLSGPLNLLVNTRHVRSSTAKAA